MACFAPRYVLSQSTSSFLDDRSDLTTGFNRLQSISTAKLAVKNQSTGIRAAATATAVVSDRPISNLISSAIDSDLVLADRIVHDENDNEFHDDSTIETESPNVPDNLEEWIRGSVTEIVKNIRQAPLLLQIYANGEVKTEKAVESRIWPEISSASPDGIILVEEIGENRSDLEDSRREEFKENGGTRAFGVLIQGKIKGRSDQCKSACYLLKTSSVNGGGGLGFGCSHYCLMKVKSFRESAASQLNGCWLVQ